MYHLPQNGVITLKIYNLAGQSVEILYNGYQTAGEHKVQWQAEGLPSGMYFIKLYSGKFSEIKKIILQK